MATLVTFGNANLQETDIASASTCDLGSVSTVKARITGTATITSFGTVANRLRFLRFAGVLTLTQNATSLILPGGIDIQTSVGDTCIATSGATGNWRIHGYSFALGARVTGNMTVNGSILLTGTATSILFNSGGGNAGGVGGNSNKTVAANAALGLNVGFGIIVYRDQVHGGFALVAAGDGVASILFQSATNFTLTDPGSGGNKWYVATSGDVTNRYSSSGTIAYSMLSAAFPTFV